MYVTTQSASQEVTPGHITARETNKKPAAPTVTLLPPVVTSSQEPTVTPPPNPEPSMHAATHSALQKATPIHITAKGRKIKHLSGSKIFDNRKRATQTWISGGAQGHYTIQIMMTADSEAEKKISDILDDEVYQKAQGHIYILHKKIKPPIIFVYHGIYNSMQEARQARDQLPTSIKKNNPFPLTIADAIKKNSR